MRVLICGGGVIGACIAYFLSRRGVEVVVVERTAVACAASGKSGGFLALDWCNGTPLDPLARRSFALHADLADEIGDDWGYRRVTTYGGFAGSRARFGQGDGRRLPWLSDDVHVQGGLGSPETTAQVHPAAFTAAMIRAAEANGARVLISEVTGIATDDRSGTVTGIDLDGETLRGDAVVIAMGPWSILATRWLTLPPVFGLKGHSIVYETGNRIPAESLFLEYRGAAGETHAPEVFPRADGTTYVCAISSDSPLPMNPASVTPDPGAIERLHDICTGLSPVLAASGVVARQACHRPVTEDGLPLVGAVPGMVGAFVATGHSVWGILNAPATGEAMAALICGDSPAVDLSAFRPERLPAFDPTRLHLAPR